MTRGKYKRKKNHAQQSANQSAGNAPTIANPAQAYNKTENAGLGTKKAKAKDHPHKMSRISEAAKRSSITDWILAIFTGFLACASIYQFIIMGGQLDVMRKDQRAWISVTPKFNAVTDVNSTFSEDVTITNSGKTPAKAVESRFYLEVVPNGGTPHFEGMKPDMVSTVGSVAPHDPREVSVIRSEEPEGNGHPLTREERAAYVKGDAWIAMHGVIFYYDIFKTRHWIRYCRWEIAKLGDYSARSCSDYNSVDDD